MSILTVVRTIIQVANIEIDAYTAGEVSSVTGAPINYLSGRGLAESIGLEESTARQNRLSKELKDLLGNGFTVRQGKYKMDSGGSTKVNLWDTVSAAKYYRYHDRQGNKIAGSIIDTLATTTLDIIINDKLNRTTMLSNPIKNQAKVILGSAANDRQKRFALHLLFNYELVRQGYGIECSSRYLALVTYSDYRVVTPKGFKQIVPRK